MKWRILCIGAGIILFSLSPAEAKTIKMGFISRADVKNACSRAGGSAFGMYVRTGSYGCSSSMATVSCSEEYGCRAQVSDIMPMTGNSLDFVLTHGRNAPAAKVITPIDTRIEPVK